MKRELLPKQALDVRDRHRQTVLAVIHSEISMRKHADKALEILRGRSP